MWPGFGSRLAHVLEGFFSGSPCLTGVFFLFCFLFIGNSELLVFTVDHRSSIREWQTISGLVVGYISLQTT
jgi:hypothetical protein